MGDERCQYHVINYYFICYILFYPPPIRLRLSAYPLFFLLLFLISSCGKQDKFEVDYLAVQFEKGDNWSIIDSKGNVVVKDEYPAESSISPIHNGVFWVKDKSGYQLFSVDSPKKPLTDDVYDQATNFVNGRAIVARNGSQIKIIADDGSVVKELPDNIVSVSAPSIDGYATFYDIEAKASGYLDLDGEVIIKPKYVAVGTLNEGYTLALEKASDKKVSVITKSDEVKSTLSTEKYKLILDYFSDGMIPVTVAGDDKGEAIYLSPDGEKKFTVSKSDVGKADYGMSAPGYYIPSFVMWDGYAVFSNKDGHFGVIDKNGETLIRAKYDKMFNTSGGKFIARKNDKWGVVDAEDNTLIDFDYNQIYSISLGGNYVVRNGDLCSVITPKGEDAFKDEFFDFSFDEGDSKISSISTSRLANTLVSGLTANGYDNLKGGETPATVAKTIEDMTPEKGAACNYLRRTEELMPGVKMYWQYDFDGLAAKTLTHTEPANNGWYSYNRTVVDGHEWTDARLQAVKLSVYASSGKINRDELYTAVVNAVKAKGFSETAPGADETVLTANGGGAKGSQGDAKLSVTVAKVATATVELRLSLDGTVAPVATETVSDAAEDGSADTQSTAPATASDDMAWLCTRLATASDVAGMSKADIRIMRNYIFARHGYKFKDQALAQYFSRYSWYKPSRTDVTSLLNDVEKKNIAFLKARE